MRTIPCAVIASFAITSSTIAFAEVEAPEPDKSSHWLFEPTPKEMMRALAPGDTPYTVDAGHMQLEVDALDTAWVREGDTHGRETSFGFTAKVGLLPRVDLHVHYSPYNHVRTTAADGMSSVAGAGDVEARVKINVWNPDGGAVALAVMPYVSVPTGDAGFGAGGVEAGVVAPFFAEAPAGFTFAVVGSAGVAHDEIMTLRGVVGATFGFTHAVAGPVGMVAEDAISVGTDRSVEHVVNTGITVGIGDDIEVDTGVRLAAPDPRATVNPYLSVIWRR